MPLIKSGHPELDEKAFLDPMFLEECKILIGVIQYAQTSLMIDAALAVPSMSRHKHQPRQGFMADVAKMLGFLKKHPKRGVVVGSSDTSQAL